MRIIISPELLNIVDKPPKSQELLAHLWQDAKNNIEQRELDQPQLTSQNKQIRYSYD